MVCLVRVIIYGALVRVFTLNQCLRLWVSKVTCVK